MSFKHVYMRAEEIGMAFVINHQIKYLCMCGKFPYENLTQISKIKSITTKASV